VLNYQTAFEEEEPWFAELFPALAEMEYPDHNLWD